MIRGYEQIILGFDESGGIDIITDSADCDGSGVNDESGHYAGRRRALGFHGWLTFQAPHSCLIQPVSECLRQLKWLHLLQSPKSDRLTDIRMFDDASRGPMGSSKVFYKRPTNSISPPFHTADPPLRYEASRGRFGPFRAQIFPAQASPLEESPRDIPMKSAMNLALYVEPKLPDLDKQNGRERCIFTTPGGLQLYGDTSSSAHWGFTHTRVNISLDNATGNSKGGLFRLRAIRFTSNFANSSTWKDGLKVHECKFTLSALEYTDWSITNGTISPGRMDAYPLNLTKPGFLVGYTVLGPAAFPYNSTFSVNFVDLNDMRQILGDALAPAPPNSVQLNVPLYNSPDIPATLANISKAMPYRMLSGPNATVARVPVLTQQIVITVRWAWIALPAVLVFTMSVPARHRLPDAPRQAPDLEVLLDAALTVAGVLPHVQGGAETALDSVVLEDTDGGDHEPPH
ncbi:hypothetical protein PG994_002110 [Apiospora phragmitis]|uniref:Uncharacterized protein n=1 Tax=Apiospora phragmitis TaxID=2905665 RepID=A0ABR1WVF9_9PEZI